MPVVPVSYYPWGLLQRLKTLRLAAWTLSVVTVAIYYHWVPLTKLTNACRLKSLRLAAWTLTVVPIAIYYHGVPLTKLTIPKADQLWFYSL